MEDAKHLFTFALELLLKLPHVFHSTADPSVVIQEKLKFGG